MMILLVDNGSLEPASTVQLRRISDTLARRVGHPVLPVSLAHSAKVAADRLDGVPASLLEPTLDRLLAEGEEQVLVLPLFIGPSYAITRHVPALLRERQAAFPRAHLRLAAPLSVPGETRLGTIVAGHVREQWAELDSPRVVVVDHGSPSPAVTRVRDQVAGQVRAELGSQVRAVSAASMERRPGPEFDFNEPQLGGLLLDAGWRSDPLIVALLFVGPGRHAGPDGDVAHIVREARSCDRVVRFTRLLGEHPLLIEILADRVAEASVPTATPAAAG